MKEWHSDMRKRGKRRVKNPCRVRDSVLRFYIRLLEGVEMKEKGLLKRLADFWKKAGPELDGGANWFWRIAGSAKKMREDAAGRGFPFRETAGTETFPLGRTFAREAEEIQQAGRRILFAEGFRKQEQGLFMAGETPQQAERRNRETLFSVEENNAPQKTKQLEKGLFWAGRKDAAAEPTGMAQAFFWTDPEENEKRRKTLPLAGGAARKWRRAEENTDRSAEQAIRKQDEKGVFWKKEEPAAERRQNADALPDIDWLMREMTKRLWEEREGCGRRLGG